MISNVFLPISIVKEDIHFTLLGSIFMCSK